MKPESKRPISCSHLTACLFLFLGTLLARGQVTVTGLADKSFYNDSVTFTIQTQAGFSYQAFVDTNEIAAGVPVTVSSVDYHDLTIYRTNLTTLDVTNQLIRFIVRSSPRGSTEDGIPPWIPWPLISSTSNEMAGAHLRLITPQDFPTGYRIPVVAWVENDQNHAVRVNGLLAAPGRPPIQIRRGVGSGFLDSNSPPGSLPYIPQLRQLSATNVINLESNTAWTAVSGTLSGTIVWPVNSRITVISNLTIPAGSSLTIGEGSIIRLNSSVDITVNGQMSMNGTTNRPIVFMPVNGAQPWGGFMLTTSTSQLTAQGTIFTGSGAVQNWYGSGGHPGSHRPEQSLFHCSSTPTLSLTDCAAMYLAGQLGHSVNGGTITFTRFLMQRTTTGGEYTGAAFKVNDSAFIECPDATTNFVDGDNDAIYIISGTHGFTNTLFGWTKDDGVDSGGSGSGLLTFSNCWFESMFHEGNSLSGNGKVVNHYGSVFMNCGQGIESGYDGPVGTLNGCLVTGNLIGGRFGDNYVRTYTGFLRATNSLLVYNYRDAWGKNWQDWNYRTNAMDVRSNWLTTPNNYHPSNAIWQPLADGWRLAAFATTPPGANVGVGFAAVPGVRIFNEITNPLTVRLSCFSTNPVAVDYAIESPVETYASGTLQFQPGETLKTIPGLVFPPANADVLRVHLGAPLFSEITTSDSLYFQRNANTNLVLQLERFGGDHVLFWSSATAILQEAGEVDGPWSDLQTPSPYQMNLSSDRRFYRLRQPVMP